MTCTGALLPLPQPHDVPSPLTTDQVAAVVCGYKQGGTTFLSSLIAAAPGLASRFECGLLQASTPAEIASIRPAVLENLVRSWKLPADGVARLAGCSDFPQVYRELVRQSGVLGGSVKLVDKFPDYTRCLRRVLDAYNGPIFFIARDPRAVFWSRQRRIYQKDPGSWDGVRPIDAAHPSTRLSRMASEYREIHRNITSAANAFPERVHLFKLEEIVVHLHEQRSRLFGILGLAVPEQTFGDVGVPEQKVRHRLDDSVVDDYRKNLTSELQAEILDRCSAASEFFFG